MSNHLKSSMARGAVAALVCASIGGGLAQAREIRRYPDVEWNRGHWVHDRHGGRLGWWWVVGSSWAYYERPHSFVVQAVPQTVVIQSAPVAPQVIVQAPPPAPVQPQMVAVQPQAMPPAMPPAPPAAPVAMTPVLYYCKATGTHYPETMSCPGGWSTMTAETPPQMVPAQ